MKLVWDKIVTIGAPATVFVYLIKWGYFAFFKSGLPFAVGGDFLCYWVGSSLALAGKPLTVYDFSMFNAMLEGAAGKAFPLAWFYPPTFLLTVLPLSLLPYLASLIVWLTITLLLYTLVIHRVAPIPVSAWLTLAFPATLLNIDYGQTGFLSAGLFGGGLMLLGRYPVLGGLLLGIFTYKPHLAIMIPVALIAGRQWKALGAMIISFGFLTVVSVFAFGVETWLSFFRNIPIATKILESGFQGYVQSWDKMITVFSVARLSGASISVACIFQGTIMLVVLVATVWVWFCGASLAVRASILTLSALLFTPHAFPYDLTILALPLAWIGWEGYTKGWLAGEKPLLFFAWWVPLMPMVTKKPAGLLIIPLTIMAVLFLALRRFKLEKTVPDKVVE